MFCSQVVQVVPEGGGEAVLQTGSLERDAADTATSDIRRHRSQLTDSSGTEVGERAPHRFHAVHHAPRGFQRVLEGAHRFPLAFGQSGFVTPQGVRHLPHVWGFGSGGSSTANPNHTNPNRSAALGPKRSTTESTESDISHSNTSDLREDPAQPG